MVQGTTWIITGWSVIGGSVVLIGFLFFYKIPEITLSTTMETTNITVGITSSPSAVTSIDTCGIPSPQFVHKSLGAMWISIF